MSVIGVIFTAFNAKPYLERALQPWIEARQAKLDGNEFLICATSSPFKGFDNEPEDGTQEYLKERKRANDIDRLVIHETPTAETEARGEVLRWLVASGAETVIQWDGDECSSAAELGRIFQFIKQRSLIACWRGSLKNYVGIPDEKTYLVQPFTPMRIHQVRYGNYTASSLWDDNNVLYQGPDGFKRDIDLSVGQIPKTVQFTPHFSWPNNSRSKRKISYQLVGRGWPTCSFDWDDARGGLIWRDGLPIPETARDE